MPWTSENPQKAAPDTGTPTPRRYRCRLETLADVRREIAVVYRQSRSNLLPVDHASKYTHMLSLMARIIEGSTLEERVAAIEAKG